VYAQDPVPEGVDNIDLNEAGKAGIDLQNLE
jgi:hypothetical protein